MYEVNSREFYIWKLERWWILFNKKEFRPENRIHLFGNWYWKI